MWEENKNIGVERLDGNSKSFFKDLNKNIKKYVAEGVAQGKEYEEVYKEKIVPLLARYLPHTDGAVLLLTRKDENLSNDDQEAYETSAFVLSSGNVYKMMALHDVMSRATADLTEGVVDSLLKSGEEADATVLSQLETLKQVSGAMASARSESLKRSREYFSDGIETILRSATSKEVGEVDDYISESGNSPQAFIKMIRNTVEGHESFCDCNMCQVRNLLRDEGVTNDDEFQNLPPKKSMRVIGKLVTLMRGFTIESYLEKTGMSRSNAESLIELTKHMGFVYDRMKEHLGDLGDE